MMPITITDELRVISLDAQNWGVQEWVQPRATEKNPEPEAYWKTLTYHATAISAIMSALNWEAKQGGITYATIQDFQSWYDWRVKEIADAIKERPHAD